MPTRRKAKPATQVNDGDHLAAQIDDAFHKVGRTRHLGDFHGADDLLHLQDVDAELFLADAERHELEELVILLFLIQIHSCSLWEKRT